MKKLFGLIVFVSILVAGCGTKIVVLPLPDFNKDIPGIFEGVRFYDSFLDTMIADVEASGTDEFTFKQRSESDTPPLVFKMRIVKKGSNACLFTIPKQTFGGAKVEGDPTFSDDKINPTNIANVNGYYDVKTLEMILKVFNNGKSYRYVLKKVK